MTHSPDDLYLTIKEFDRCLKKEYLATLTLEEAHLILGKIHLFQARVALEMPSISVNGASFDRRLESARELGKDFGKDFNDPEADYHTEYLMVVGCRLCSDLNEQVLLRLMDLTQEQEQEAERLYTHIRKNVRDRHHLGQLLEKSQQIRNQTFDNAQSMGLGVIL